MHVHRLQQLRSRLAAELDRDGSVACATSGLGVVSVQEWHAAALGAADDLHRPVSTGLTRLGVAWAVIADWPRTAEELVRAGQRSAAARDGSRSPQRPRT